MKKLFPVVLIATFAMLTIMPSCKKSDSSPSKSMSATVNGTTFNASTVEASTALGGLSVSGVNGTKALDFWLDSTFSTTTTGTYSMSHIVLAEYLTDTTFSGSHVFDSGSVKITAVSANSATGTFSFYSTSDSTTVTNGTFSTTW